MKPGITSVKMVNVMAYHKDLAAEKCGAQMPTLMSNRYGATSKNGGIVARMATNQPHANPQTTCEYSKNLTQYRRGEITHILAFVVIVANL